MYSKIAKNRAEGPKTHPWGTVLLIMMADVIAESILTVCGLSLRNLCIQWMIGGGILELWMEMTGMTMSSVPIPALWPNWWWSSCRLTAGRIDFSTSFCRYYGPVLVLFTLMWFLRWWIYPDVGLWGKSKHPSLDFIWSRPCLKQVTDIILRALKSYQNTSSL